jgi:hypothetical protein
MSSRSGADRDRNDNSRLTLHVPGYDAGVARWAFLTPHMRALVSIARDPGLRIRDVADRLEITERAAHRIVSDLVTEGYLTRHKLGARNYYEVHPERPMRHSAEADHEVGELLAVLLDRPGRRFTGDTRESNERDPQVER